MVALEGGILWDHTPASFFASLRHYSQIGIGMNQLMNQSSAQTWAGLEFENQCSGRHLPQTFVQLLASLVLASYLNLTG